jgi:hypothetical protein
MQRIEVIRRMTQVVTKDDLLTTSIDQTRDDWWNYKPAYLSNEFELLSEVMRCAGFRTDREGPAGTPKQA